MPLCSYYINDYLQFDLGLPAMLTAMYIAFYYSLEPVAAVRLLTTHHSYEDAQTLCFQQFLYTPQIVLSLLTSTAVARDQERVIYAVGLHIFAWAAQILSHGVAEGRSPALMDNLVGGVYPSHSDRARTHVGTAAVALAPFFVHIEILFYLGYRPELHKAVKAGINQELARIKAAEAQKKGSPDQKFAEVPEKSAVAEKQGAKA
jgi:2-hydroxy fatty acid dioxygenase